MWCILSIGALIFGIYLIIQGFLAVKKDEKRQRDYWKLPLNWKELREQTPRNSISGLKRRAGKNVSMSEDEIHQMIDPWFP